MRQEVLNADPSFLLWQVVIFVAHQTQVAKLAKNEQVHVEEALEVVISVVVIRRIQGLLNIRVWWVKPVELDQVEARHKTKDEDEQDRDKGLDVLERHHH